MLFDHGKSLLYYDNTFLLLLVDNVIVMWYSNNMNCLKCNKLIEETPAYGLHQVCFTKLFDLDGVYEFTELDPKSSETKKQSPEIKKKKDTFFHGNYLKYSARLNGQEYILKIQEDEYPELPVMEYVCNQIAKILGLEVPKFYLINFNGKMTFVTRNFMQDYVGALHHIYKFLPDGEENHNCQEIASAIFKQTNRPIDIAKFIEVTLFDSLVGNNDRHGRNLGIIDTGKARTLSPIYDNPSYIGIAAEFILGAQISPSGSIWTSTSQEPRVQEYVDEFIRLDYQRIVKLFVKKVLTKEDDLVKIVDNSILSEQRKVAFKNLLKSRVIDFEKNK